MSTTLANLSENPSSPWIPIICVAVVLGVAIGIGVFATRQARRNDEAWRNYAGARGFQFVEGWGPWYRRRGTSIQGVRDGAEFTLDRYIVSTGKSSTTFTRIRAACPRAGNTRMSLGINGVLTAIGRMFGRKYLESGDHAFDARFAVRGPASASVDGIFDPRTRERLLAVPRRFQLKLRDGRATMNWHGWETREPVLDAAIDAMAALCRPETQPVGR